MKLLDKIRSFRKKQRQIKKFDQVDAQHPTNLDSKLEKKYYDKGFFATNIINYNLEENDYKHYVTDWDRLFKIREMNSRYKFILKDKMIFHNYFKNDPRIVRPLAFINKGRLVDFSTKEICSPKVFSKGLKKDLIIKACRGGRGKDIYRIKVESRKKEAILKDLQKVLNKNKPLVIQEWIIQDGIYHKINPHSVNTIRMQTMQDPETGAPFIARAVQRFGTKQSDYVDNLSAGGITVSIDLERGIYKKGTRGPQNNKLKWLSHHPDTDIKFEGLRIDNFKAMKTKILELSKELFYIDYIGWDIIPFKNDFLILEANYNTDVDGFQVYKPLLKDPKIKAFYKAKKVINQR